MSFIQRETFLFYCKDIYPLFKSECNNIPLDEFITLIKNFENMCQHNFLNSINNNTALYGQIALAYDIVKKRVNAS